MRRAVAVLVVASLVLVSCASAWDNKAATVNGLRVVWQPNFHDGYTLLCIAYEPLPDIVLPDGTVTSGRHKLKVFIDDKRVFQRIETTSNVAGTTWMRQTVEYELVADLSPDLAATEDGWRDTNRRHRYILREFDDAVGRFAMSVYGDGANNYWLTVTQYAPREVPVRGMPHKDAGVRTTKGGE